jgi:hypothetical protein
MPATGNSGQHNNFSMKLLISLGASEGYSY